jgi:hypothetical protein
MEGAMRSLRPFIQAAICGGGLLGGLAVGAVIVFGTGFIQLGELLGTPRDFVIIIVVSIAVVFGLAWLGVTIGLALARRIAQ